MRECKIIEKALIGSKPALKVLISPEIPGQDIGFPQGVSKGLVTARLEGFDVWNMKKFPVFVFFCSLVNFDRWENTRFLKEDLVVVGLGELYRTQEDAKEHRFEYRDTFGGNRNYS